MHFMAASMSKPRSKPTSWKIIFFQALMLFAVLLSELSPGLASAATPAEFSWPQFGGPRRDFTLQREEIDSSLLTWPATGPQVVWERTIGDGFAAAVISRNTLVTMFCRDETETIIALNPDSGRELWKHTYACPFDSWEYGSGAFSTPTIVGQRVYCIGIMAQLHCLDLATGKVLWQHDLVREYGGRIPGHGYGCSPLAVGNLIVLSVGGPADDYTMEPISQSACESIFAFDQTTGDVVWKSLNHRIRHASPLLIDVEGQQQIVMQLYGFVVGLHPVNGKLLWEVEIPGHTNVSVTPVWHERLQLVLCANSYGQAKGTHAIQLRRVGQQTIATRLWDNSRVENWHSSMVLDGPELIVSAGGSQSFLMAIDLQDGGRVLAKQRGFGKTNVVKLADRYLLLDEHGTLALARRAAKGFDVLGTRQVLSDRCWTAPTVVGDTIYVRNQQQIKALRFGS